MQYKLSVHIT